MTVITAGRAGGAVISEDGRYRYALNRRWDLQRPVMPWIGLNPSTADADTDDHTIRRMRFYAERDGYGGLCVLNLYALRATDPAVLRGHPDPVGPGNDAWLAGLTEDMGVSHAVYVNPLRPVMLAWGAHPLAAARVPAVLELLAGLPLACLGTTKSGAPRHPARLSNDVPVVPWTPPGGTR